MAHRQPLFEASKKQQVSEFRGFKVSEFQGCKVAGRRRRRMFIGRPPVLETL